MRRALGLLNVATFCYQVLVSTRFFVRKFPEYGLRGAAEMVWDTVLGSALPGPLTLDFGCRIRAAGGPGPHRLLTSGFLHGGVFHLVADLVAMQRLPLWLETGLGAPLFLTTFLLSTTAANYAHCTKTFRQSTTLYNLGASGGIAGLYGLLFVSMARMRNREAIPRVARGMGLLLLYGFLFEHVNNAAHATGFASGVVLALLFGPRYRRSYSMRRKWATALDPYASGYRQAMGFGVVPTAGILPLTALWFLIAACVLSIPELRSVPSAIVMGLVRPGSISGITSEIAVGII